MAQNYNYDIALGNGKHITQDGSIVATMNSLAPAYDNTATYAVGDLCNHDGKLYSCSTAISTSEEWNSEHWTELNISEKLNSIKGFDGHIESSSASSIPNPNKSGVFTLKTGTNRYGILWVNDTGSGYACWFIMRQQESNSSYLAYTPIFGVGKGNYNSSTLSLKQCTAMLAYNQYDTFGRDVWDTTPTYGSFNAVTSGGIYNSIQSLDNSMISILAPAYDSTATYEVGDLCSRSASSSMTDAKLYVCTTAITVAEAWDASHWSETTLAQQLQTQVTNAINASY